MEEKKSKKAKKKKLASASTTDCSSWDRENENTTVHSKKATSKADGPGQLTERVSAVGRRTVALRSEEQSGQAGGSRISLGKKPETL